jgi:hypothetical protein
MEKATEGEAPSPSPAIDPEDPGTAGVNPPPQIEQDATESRALGTGAHTRHHSRRIMPETTDAGAPQMRVQGQSPLQEPAVTTQPHATTGDQQQGQPPAQPHKIKSDQRQQELMKGSHPGDRYVRYGRKVGPFRRKGTGKLLASLRAVLLFRPNTVLAHVPYLLGQNRAAQAARVKRLLLVAAPLAAIFVLAMLLYVLYLIVVS